MALQTLNTIKQWFRTGLKPTQAQFWDTWDSFRHKFEKIPVKDIDGIDELLLSKADKTVLDNHLADKSAHAPQVNTDWNSESGFSQLLNKPEFRTVNGQTIVGTGDIAITTESADLQSVLDNGSYAKLENKTVQIYNHGANPLDYSQSTSHPNFIQITNMKNNNSGRFEVGRGFANIVQSTAEGNTTTVEFENNFSETGNKVNMKFPSKPTGDYTLSTTSDFKTINGESIIGEGNLDIEPQGLKSVLDADPTASYGESKATLMGDYGTSKFNEIIVSDETEKTGIYQLKNQLSFDHTVLDSNDIGNITLSEGNVILTRDKSNNQTVVDISDPVANTQLRFPAKSEEGKTYTIATTDDFKTINGESIVGSGDILINGGDGNIPTLQEVLDKDRNATNATINLLSEDGESQTTVHEGGLNISKKTESGFLITDINKLGVSVSKDEETTFVNVLADELSLNKNLSGNPVKQGIVLNQESSGASTIKLPLTSDGDVKTLATTKDFKTINGESIVGEGDITIEGGTTPDATTAEKGIVKLAGDLGGTADAPTTPTAVHKTGDETISGIKTVPTASIGTTTGQIASTAFVMGAPFVRLNGNDSITGSKFFSGNNRQVTIMPSTGQSGGVTTVLAIDVLTASHTGLRVGMLNNTVGISTGFQTGTTKGTHILSTNPGGLSVFEVGFSGDVKGKSFIRTGGLATEYLKADGSVSTLTNPITGTGTGNNIPIFTSSGVLGNSSFYESNGTLVANRSGQIPGTTSPSGGFLLTDQSNTSYSLEMGANTGSGPWIQARSYINATMYNLALNPNGGNVGIGTTAPTVKLDVFQNDNTSAFIVKNSTNSFYVGNDADGTFLGGYKVDNSNFTPLQLQKFGGNVGIGTATPAVKLDVRGKLIVGNTDVVVGSVGSLIQIDQGGATSGNTYSRIGAYNIGGTNPTSLILNSDGGNVGIGTTQPVKKLVVSNNNAESLEFGYSPGKAEITAYNRTSNSYIDLNFDAGKYVFSVGNASFTGTVTAAPATIGTELVTLNQLNGVATSGTFTPLTSGTTVYDICYWSQVGKIVTVRYNLSFTSTGASSTTIGFVLPSGKTDKNYTSGQSRGSGAYKTGNTINPMYISCGINNTAGTMLIGNTASANYTASFTISYETN